ncbi:MAG: isoaspartyl peptidase/L-asparaginase [Promethearchaeota archaeon]
MKEKVVLLAHSGVSSTAYGVEREVERLRVTAGAVKAGFERAVGACGVDLESVDLVEETIKFMEASGMTNSGRGAVLQTDGRQRLDASIQRGDTLDCGAVASLRSVLHPISVARGIMERTPHCQFAHDFAEKLARDWGLEFYDDSECARARVRARDHGTSGKGEHVPETVGAVAVFRGIPCAGTSTGGLSNSLPGRIGDTPAIGSGTYANEVCAVSLTGRGEDILKMCCAKRVADLVLFNEFSPQAAAETMVEEYARKFDGTIGAIVVDVEGRWGVDFKGERMGWALVEVPVKEKVENLQVLCGAKRGEKKFARVPS